MRLPSCARRERCDDTREPLRATDFGPGYEERQWLDADTGVVSRFEGGAPGQRPAVTITYDVK